jgi:hypothetical protein
MKKGNTGEERKETHGNDPVLVPPESFRKYFWDADWNDLNRNAEVYKEFILCRIADKGDLEAVRWLVRRVSAAQIADTVARSRTVSEKSRNFWKNAAVFF